MINARFILAAVIIVAATMLQTQAAETSPGGDSRFAVFAQARNGSARWVTVEAEQVAFGAGRRAWVGDVADIAGCEAVDLGAETLEAVLAGNRLYMNRGHEIVVRDLGKHRDEDLSIRLTPAPRGLLHIARMDDYLVVVEDGFGLRVLTLPPPPGHKMKSHHHDAPYREVGKLLLRERFVSVATTVRRIYALTDPAELTIVDARNPSQPDVVSRRPLDVAPDAIAANGPRVYLLEPEGLRVLDFSRRVEPVVEGPFAGVRGNALKLTGRVFYVADDANGLTVFRDRAVTTATHFVTVSDRVFTPANLTIELGDTVRWDNIDGFHNVESCDGASDPVECAGQVAVEGTFGSGAPSNDEWTYSRTFNVIGDNRYFCIVHVDDNMMGAVTVNAPAAADHFVTVSDFTFTPTDLVVNPGDVVQWDNLAGFHNVEACDGAADPAGCGGEVAAEGSFELPGGPTNLAWTYQRLFSVPGANPYFCVVHAALGMFGNVTAGALAGPPAVPDGVGVTTPMTVDRGAPAEPTLSVSWDASVCPGAAGHQIVYGGGSQLPSTFGGTYGVSGGVCSIGTTSPFSWTNSPDPTLDPSGLLWFLVVANDGAAVEGPWGADSAGGERHGPGADGSSGSTVCHSSKDTSNTCGR